MMDAINCASSACGAKLLSCTVRFKETSEPLCGLGTSWLASRRAMSCWRVPVCVRLCCASRRRRGSVAIDRKFVCSGVCAAAAGPWRVLADFRVVGLPRFGMMI